MHRIPFAASSKSRTAAVIGGFPTINCVLCSVSRLKSELECAVLAAYPLMDLECCHTAERFFLNMNVSVTFDKIR
jgi:hypothetical protein